MNENNTNTNNRNKKYKDTKNSRKSNSKYVNKHNDTSELQKLHQDLQEGLKRRSMNKRKIHHYRW